MTWGFVIRPQKDARRRPVFCGKNQFSMGVLKVILPELEEYWPSMHYNNNTELWQHEWLKYGTCGMTGPLFYSALEYFLLALKLHEKYNLKAILERNGIVPSDTGYFSYNDFQKAIKRELHVTPHIVWQFDKVSFEYDYL